MKLKNKKVAFVVGNGFEPSELKEPLQALQDEGAECKIISPETGTITGWKDGWKDAIEVDLTLAEADPADFDALVIPGGTINCDSLRSDSKAIQFVKEMFAQKKPVSAICHGPQLLIEADVVEGRKLTSYKSIKTDLQNAGAVWKDEACVCDKGLTTSRNPDDLPAFISKTIEEIVEGRHSQRDVHQRAFVM